MSRRSSRPSAQGVSYVDSYDEVEDLFASTSSRRSTRAAPSSATGARKAREQRTRRQSAEERPPSVDHLDSLGSDDGRLVPYNDDEDGDDDVQVLAASPGPGEQPSTPPHRRKRTPSSHVVVVSDVDEPEAGPSRLPSRPSLRTQPVVEIPYLPLDVLATYTLSRGSTLPTKISRRRVLAEQDDDYSPPPRRPTVNLTPSKRKRSRSLSSDSGFGGYGDDTDDLEDEREDELDSWESDGSSDDGIVVRRTTRQSGRNAGPETRRTRSQRVSTSSLLTVQTMFGAHASQHQRNSQSLARSQPPSPVARTRMRGRPAERRRSSVSSSAPSRVPTSSRARRASTDEDPTFEEGESEIDDDDDFVSTRSVTPKLPKAPTRRILENHRSVRKTRHSKLTADLRQMQPPAG